MKRKELKNLAKRIAEAELIVQNSDDKDKVARAQNEIMELTSHLHSVLDLEAVDEMVQEILKNS